MISNEDMCQMERDMFNKIEKRDKLFEKINKLNSDYTFMYEASRISEVNEDKTHLTYRDDVNVSGQVYFNIKGKWTMWFVKHDDNIIEEIEGIHINSTTDKVVELVLVISDTYNIRLTFMRDKSLDMILETFMNILIRTRPIEDLERRLKTNLQILPFLNDDINATEINI